nr:MAG TPA: minor tail protein [Caudoviricetes sp.]
MTEDIVLNITANIQPMADELNHLMSTMELVPNKEQLTEAIDSIHGAYQTIKTEIESDTGGIFADIPARMESALTRTITSIRSQITSLDGAFKKIGKNLDGDKISSVYQQTGFIMGNVQTMLDGLQDLRSFTKSATPQQMSVFNNTYMDFARAINGMTQNMQGKGGIGIASASELFKHFTDKNTANAAERAAFQNFTKALGLSGDGKSLFTAMSKLSLPSTWQREFYDISRQHAKGALPENYRTTEQYDSFRERLPERLRAMPYTPQTISPSKMRKGYQEVLSEAEYNTIYELAKKNEAFRQSLLNLGYGRYGVDTTGKYPKAGTFFLRPRLEFTKGMLGRTEDELYYNQLKRALESNVVNFTKLNTTDEQEVGRLARRSSSTAQASYEALGVTSSIMKDLMPVHLSKRSIPMVDPNVASVPAGIVARPRKDMFIIPSLTPEDAKKGELPKDPNIRWGKEAQKKLTGKSAYVTAEESWFTNLAHMHGDRSLGNGKYGNVYQDPSIVNDLPMFIMDFSDRLTQTDANGRPIRGANGAPMENAETQKEVAKLFQRNTPLQYTYNGEQKMYMYPRYETSFGGKKRGYVPVTAKGGGVYFIRENDYVAESKKYLEGLGANVFDNFRSKGYPFTSFEKANKDLEAVNRFITGSIPFTQLGGINPDIDKVGVVDISSLFPFNAKDKESQLPIDGSMLMMPGHIPGGDAIIRAPFMNGKGVAQSFDYKGYLRDLFGLKEGEPFYLPGVNMPDDLNSIYQKAGLAGIQKHKTYGGNQYQDTLSKYFVDIMGLDALIDKSLIKSTILDPGTGSRFTGEAANKEIQRRMRFFGPEGLFRVVDTAEGHSTNRQTSLSTQIGQNLMMTPEEIKENRDKHLQFIKDLQTNPEVQKTRVFNTDSALDVAFRANPTMLQNSPAAQTKLQQRIMSEEQALREGKLFAQGELSMEIALANYGSVLASAGMKNGYRVQNNDLLNTFSLGENQFATSDYQKFLGKAVATDRYPSTVGQTSAYEVQEKLSQAIRSGAYGLNPYGVYYNPSALAKMGGGDFDGDTVQIIIGKIAEVAKRTYEIRSKQLAPYKAKKQAIESEFKKMEMPGNGTIDENFIASAVARQAGMTILLGSVSNVQDALGQGNWDDPNWVAQIGRAASVDASRAYDIDSTFLKTGVAAPFTDAMWNAMKMGRPFTSIYKNLNSAIAANDFSKMPKLSTVNFPSIFSSTSALMMASMAEMPLSNESIERMLQQQMIQEGFSADDIDENVPHEKDTARKAMARYINASNKIKAAALTRGAIASDEQYGDLRARLQTFKTLLDKERRNTNSDDVVAKAKLDEMEKVYQHQSEQLRFARLYGLTEETVNTGKGYAAGGLFKNNPIMGQESEFQLALQNQRDADTLTDLQRYSAAAEIATNGVTNAMLKQSIGATDDFGDFSEAQKEISRVAEKTKKDLRYSYTQMSKFSSDKKTDQDEWYNRWGRRMRGETEILKPTTFEQFLGTAFHKAVQNWEMRRIAVQNGEQTDDLTAEETLKFFEEELLKPSKNDNKQFFQRDENGNLVQVLETNKKNKNKLSDARNTLSHLQNIYDRNKYDIVGSEYILDKNNGILPNGANVFGALDSVVYNKDTKQYEIWDWKARAGGHDERQLYYYQALWEAAERRMPEKDRRQIGGLKFFGYLENGKTEELPLDESKVKEAVEWANSVYTNINSLAAATGLDKSLLEFARSGGNRWTQYKTPEEVLGVISRARYAGAAVNTANPLSKGYTVNYGAGKPDHTVDEIANQSNRAYMAREMYNVDYDALNATEKATIDTMSPDELATRRAQAEYANTMNRNTGKGIANALNMQNKANTLEDRIKKYSSDLFVRRLKANDERFNPWENTANELKGFDTQIENLTNMGLDSLVVDQLETLKNQAFEDYRKTLQIVAPAELNRFSESIEKTMNAPKKKTATSDYQGQYAALQKEFEQRTQAYNQLMKDQSVEMPPDANDAMAKARESFHKYRDSLLTQRANAFDLDMQKTQQMLSKGKITNALQMQLQMDAARQSIADRRKQLELDYGKDGILSGNTKQYQAEKAKLDELESKYLPEYERRLQNESMAKSDRQLRQFEKFQRNSASPRRGMYAQMYERRLDNIDALKDYKTAFTEGQQTWKDRMEVIKTDWVNKNGEGEGYKQLDMYKQAASMVQKYGTALSNTQKQLDSFGNSHTKIASGVDALKASMGNMMTIYLRRFGRQLIQEATQFVKQYDAAITEIQVVTRKSDEEVNKLGDDMMKVAKDLKVSFSDVAKATTELYRQGLSDEEVNERREQVLKFSKVAGVSATDATKLITVGVNSGLFKDAKEVTDVVTALGDSAATNAGQIQKGIQKAGYAAKEAGVSGKELSAMLTVITAGTQLSGNVAGTTLRNVFSRINRVKNPNEVVYDEKGNAMTANTLAAVLNSAGISMYENGQMKGTTQILTDIGKVWDSLSDNKKNQIAYQLGGTQQYSNVAALMAGFAETDENGQTLMEKYLQLADESGNIVDEKYVDQADNLTAALTNLSNAFNALTASVTDSEAIKGFVNVLATAIEGVGKLNNALGGIPSLLATIGIAAFALKAILGTSLLPIIGTIGSLLAIGYLTNSNSNSTSTTSNISTTSVAQEKNKTKIDEDYEKAKSLLKQASEISEKAERGKATQEDVSVYNNAAIQLREMGISCMKTISSIDDLSDEAKNVANQLNDAANQIKDKNDNDTRDFAMEKANDLYAAARRDTQPVSLASAWLSDLSYYDGAGKLALEIKQNYPDLFNALENTDENFNDIYSSYISNGGEPLHLPNGVDLEGIRFGHPEDSKFTSFMSGLLLNGMLNDVILAENHSSVGTYKGDFISNDKIKDFNYRNAVASDPAVLAAVITRYFKLGDTWLANPFVSELPDVAVRFGDNLQTYISKFYESMLGENSELASALTSKAVASLNETDISGLDEQSKADLVKTIVVTPFTYSDGRLMSPTDFSAKAVNLTGYVDPDSLPFDLSTSSASAAAMYTSHKYGNAYSEFYDALRSTYGTRGSAKEMFEAAQEKIAEIPTIEGLIADEDNADISRIISGFYDNNGNVRQDLTMEDLLVLMSVVAGHDNRIFSDVTSKKEKQESILANGVHQRLKNNPYRYKNWNNLGYATEETTQAAQEAFKAIVGEDVMNTYLTAGTYSPLGLKTRNYLNDYVERKIQTYGTNKSAYSDLDYATTARDVLNDMESFDDVGTRKQFLQNLPSELVSELNNIDSFKNYTDLLQMTDYELSQEGLSADDVSNARNKAFAAIDEKAIKNQLKFNDALDETVSLLAQIKKGGSDAASAMQTMYSKTEKLANAKWAISQYKSGQRTDLVTSTLASNFEGVDQTSLKYASAEAADMYVKTFEASLEDKTDDMETVLGTNLTEALAELNLDDSVIVPSIDLSTGAINISGFVDALNETGDSASAAFASLVQSLASLGAEFFIDLTDHSVQVKLGGMKSSTPHSSGGGGGKSDADKLVDKIKKGQALYEHRVKMVQYKQTEYTNADELTNYGRMIEKEMEIEQSYLPVVQENIQKLKEQMAKTKVGSDDWYTLRDAILSAEETYEEINKTLDENKKKLEENQQAILKLHTDLEDSVTEEIKNRIQKERDMTDGAVTMQETILNAIKNRLSEEWELQKKDIEKKKEALEEEKSLIDERLQARKDAEDEAEKYEELAELKKQLASVEMDSSRTKDAAQLRKSIADLEKEIGWDIADKEADNAKNEIQDQMDAYDDYITKGDEDLEELLKDANNFSEEVNNVLKMNQSELFDWLKNNVKEYTESLKDAQQQMVNSWSDTYKQMMGLTDTYWDEVAEILSSKESYLEYMKNSDEYLNASDDMKAQLRYQWEDAYDKWILALKDTTNYDHFDNGLGDMSGSEYGTGTSSGTGADGDKKTNAALVKAAIEAAKLKLTNSLPFWTHLPSVSGLIYGKSSTNNTDWTGATIDQDIRSTAKYGTEWRYAPTSSELEQIIKGKYATGGLANYTGLAWLDGTPSKPERVLNAQQTESFERLVNVMDSLRASGVSLENLRSSMLDTRIHLPNLSPSIDPSTIGGNIANIGDVNVTIEEAELNDDRDYDEIAQIVGEKFAKEISKQGINIAKYNF